MMVELTRTIRFCVSSRPVDNPSGLNTFAASPSMAGLGAFYELRLACRGIPDARTGYLINITDLDAIARRKLVPIIQLAYTNETQTEPAELLPTLFDTFHACLGDGAWSLQWFLSPYYCLMIKADNMTRIQISQQFEFAAAHRLNVPELSDDDNRRIFGKCNNTNGHGHNYQLEVAVTVPIQSDNGSAAFSLTTLEDIVTKTVLERFDHTNLNLDCPEFEKLNPSVENIASISFNLLDAPITAGGGELHHVTVWETPKTCCTVARSG